MTDTDFQSRLQSAQHLLATGRYEAAKEAYAALLEAQTNKMAPTRILALDGWGRCQHALGNITAAEEAFTQSLELLELTFGPNHPHVALGLQNISRLLTSRGALEEAASHAERAVAILLSTLGAAHPRLADALLNLSAVHYEREEFDQAEARLKQAQGIWEATLGHESMEVSTCLNNLGRILERRGLSGQGAALHRQAANMRLRLLGDHPETAFSLGNLGTALAGDEQWEEACQALEAALACYERLGMGDDAGAGTCRANLQLCRTALNATAHP